MEADWSVECGADDPTVTIPWSGISRADGDKSIRYIDLRNTPSQINEIPEALENPCLATALLRWNDPTSPLFTAKCDVWSYASDLFDAGDLPGFAYAQGSYVDLLPRAATIFSNFSSCEHLLRAWTEVAQSIEFPESRCEWILRSAYILPISAKALDSVSQEPVASGSEGFSTTLYVWGYGSSPQAAEAAWSKALLALVEPILLVKSLNF